MSPPHSWHNLWDMWLTDLNRRSSRIFLPALSCLLLTGLSSPVRAQDFGIPPTVLKATPVPDYARLVLGELNRPVQLTMVDGSVLRGMVGGADAAEFTLLIGGLSLMESRVGVSWARISEVRIDRRSRIVEGLFLGGAGGALIGILNPLGDDTSREYLGIGAPGRVWDTAAQGAVLGAVVGLLHGLDFVLPHTPQSFGMAGPFVPSRRQPRPSMRLVNTVPSQSLTISDIEESLEASPFGEHNPFIDSINIHTDRSWNGHAGSTVALETSWQWDQHWWLRSRLEWTSLPRISLETLLAYFVTGKTYHIWREYSSWRSMVGMALPFGAVGRLPVAEIAFLAGLSRTTLQSHYSTRGGEPSAPANSEQTVYRPVIMASASLALLRRPKLAVALRAEGIMGAGFNANALITDTGFEVIPKRRITPIGLSIGVEVLFPNF